MISMILYYIVSLFFIGGGLFVIIRSSIALKKRKFKDAPFPDVSRNWHLASIFTGIIATVMGILLLLRIP